MLTPDMSPEPSSYAFSPTHPSMLLCSDYLNDKVDWENFVHLEDEGEDDPVAERNHSVSKQPSPSLMETLQPATPPEEAPLACDLPPPNLGNKDAPSTAGTHDSDMILPDCADPAHLIIAPPLGAALPLTPPGDVSLQAKLNPFRPPTLGTMPAPSFLDILSLPPPPPPPGWPAIPPSPEMCYYYAIWYAQCQQQISAQPAFLHQNMPLPIPMPMMLPDPTVINPKPQHSSPLYATPKPRGNTCSPDSSSTSPKTDKGGVAAAKLESPVSARRKRVIAEQTDVEAKSSDEEKLSPRALRSLKRQSKAEKVDEKREIPRRSCKKDMSKKQIDDDDYGDDNEMEVSEDDEYDLEQSDNSVMEYRLDLNKADSESVAASVKKRRSSVLKVHVGEGKRGSEVMTPDFSAGASKKTQQDTISSRLRNRTTIPRK